MITNKTILLPSLSVPATPDHLCVLRDATRTAIRYQPLQADARTDLVLAVDEASVTLVEHATADSRITCIFEIDFHYQLRVHLSTTTLNPFRLTTTSQKWIILQALVDNVSLEYLPPVHQGESWTVTVTLTKSPPPSPSQTDRSEG